MILVNFKNFHNLQNLIFRTTLTSFHLRSITCYSTQKFSKTETVFDEDDANKPIEYSKSDAARWKAQITRRGVSETGPWYQSYVVATCLTIFMAYFFFLREESDIDLEFSKNLYDRINGLEEKNLEIVLEHNKAQNLPLHDIENRLNEIRKEKSK